MPAGTTTARRAPVIPLVLAFGASAALGGHGMRALRGEPIEFARRRRHQLAVFDGWHGLATAILIAALSLRVFADAVVDDHGMADLPAYLTACALGGLWAVDRRETRDRVVLVTAVAGITGCHLLLIFLTPAAGYRADGYYLPVLAAFWGAFLLSALFVDLRAEDLPATLATAFAALLLLTIVVDSGPSGPGLDARLTIAVGAAVPLALATATIPRLALPVTLLATAAAFVAGWVLDGWSPGLLLPGDPLFLAVRLAAGLGLAGYLVSTGAGGEETRRVG